MKIKTIGNQACKLHVLENLKKQNFSISRIFFLDSNKTCVRGNHAHKKCTQIFLSLKGNIDITIENKKGIKEIKLEKFKSHLKVLPLNWVKIKMKKNQLLMVICNKNFSEEDYIRNYPVFLKYLKK
tara:strand:- start:665 stop:1042 length:378 start_codon:yes stop_codon:yes gene_type:complete